MAAARIQTQRLEQILQARRDAAQVDFESVCAEILKVRNILAELGHNGQEPDQAYLALGADDLWHHWVAQRREALFRELARLHVLREDKARVLKNSNGRAQAFGAVVKQKQAAHAQISERNALASLNEMMVTERLARTIKP